MKPIKSIVLDLDGTLVSGSGEVSRAARNVLKQLKDQGCLIGLSSEAETDTVLKKLPVWNLDDLVSFLISNNGADYINFTSSTHIQTRYLKKEQIQEFLNEIDKFPITCGLEYGNRIYWNRPSFRSVVHALRIWKRSVNSWDHLPDGPFSKLLILGPKSSLQSISRKAGKFKLKLLPLRPGVLQAVHPDLSKYVSLKCAMMDFGFSQDEVMYFGNSQNDIEVLRRTYGVAMKNSDELSMEAARETTKYTNSQDGVAYHLNAALINHYPPFYDEQQPEKKNETDMDQLDPDDSDMPVDSDNQAAFDSSKSLNSYINYVSGHSALSSKNPQDLPGSALDFQESIPSSSTSQSGSPDCLPGASNDQTSSA